MSFSAKDCPEEAIASWSSDGRTFLVHNVERFADQEIPRYFNHSNFASFVRQLNCYGFRKIKKVEREDDRKTTSTSSNWEFHHPHFRQGSPEELALVRKTEKNAFASKEEVEELRRQLSELKDIVLDVKDMLVQFQKKLARTEEQDTCTHNRTRSEPLLVLAEVAASSTTTPTVSSSSSSGVDEEEETRNDIRKGPASKRRRLNLPSSSLSREKIEVSQPNEQETDIGEQQREENSEAGEAKTGDDSSASIHLNLTRSSHGDDLEEGEPISSVSVTVEAVEEKEGEDEPLSKKINSCTTRRSRR